MRPKANLYLHMSWVAKPAVTSTRNRPCAAGAWSPGQVVLSTAFYSLETLNSHAAQVDLRSISSQWRRLRILLVNRLKSERFESGTSAIAYSRWHKLSVESRVRAGAIGL